MCVWAALLEIMNSFAYSHFVSFLASLTSYVFFQIDYVVPYEFTCLLCGEPCVFEIPVLEVTRTLDMPPCPIGPSYHNRIREKLMKFSPTGGIKTKLEGTVVMTTKEGNVIAEFSVSARVK